MHGLAHVLGLDDPSGRWYLWWSGFGADLGLFGAPLVMWRRHNCEVYGCWRIGRHTTTAGHRVCRRHHPDDHLTRHHIARAHQAAADPDGSP
ncbi:hypothetical protein EDD90_2748 [Streptomyces sp. Ag109_O5-1]|uniref:hypothetical protein n=1 Tax=Streptomyces sp. Ag109_O5-1 TaxID=1938851 RepID=UPI000F4F3632|nr:hypothetical protein [Streptomyces sp. Ag109_O5-1]RPE39731.1 hypothetical protein EDD90_2748 [Streptomyces sp. Ag109_O5-1]